MCRNNVYMYVFDTLADWEWGYITAELRTGRFFKKGVQPFAVKTFGLTKEPIATMGGIRIIPDLSIDEIDMHDCAFLLLPGGETWLEPIHAAVVAMAKDFLAKDIPVVAICGATMALAAAGVLDERRHTSNDLAYLKGVCPNYKGEAHYQFESAVSDNNLITAGGIAPLEAACQIFKRLAVFSDETLDYWYKVHKLQDPQYFYKLVNSLK